MNYLKTIVFVIVLLAIGYFLAPYVKIKPKQNSPTDQTTQTNTSTVKTFTSDNLGISFKFDTDQDGDGKPDTDAKEVGDKIYVYYSATPAEQGQSVQKFSKDINVSLTDAIKTKFLANYSAADCYPQTLSDYYKSYDVEVPTFPSNVEEAVIAYPKTTDPNQPYWQNAEKCPQAYSASNGISYFYMDKNHPDRYFFFSIGQYGILAEQPTDGGNGKTWQDTFTITK